VTHLRSDLPFAHFEALIHNANEFDIGAHRVENGFWRRDAVQKGAKTHGAPSQRFQVTQQRVHASSGAQHAQDRHRTGRYFGVACVTNHRSVATLGNTGGQFVKSGFVLDAQDDLSGTSSPPPFQQTGPSCSLNDIDSCMSALGGGFSGA